MEEDNRIGKDKLKLYLNFFGGIVRVVFNDMNFFIEKFTYYDIMEKLTVTEMIIRSSYDKFQKNNN